MKVLIVGACILLMGTAAYGQEIAVPPPQAPQNQFFPRDILKMDTPSIGTSIASSSNLTIEQLYTLINERDRQYQQRFESQEKAVNAALIAAKEAVNAALSAAQTAVNKAEIANEKRLDNQNEFRGQLKDQASTLLPRTEAEARFKAIEVDLNRMNNAIIAGTGRFEGVQWLWGILGAIGGGIITIIGVGLSLRSAFPRKV